MLIPLSFDWNLNDVWTTNTKVALATDILSHKPLHSVKMYRCDYEQMFYGLEMDNTAMNEPSQISLELYER